MKHVKSSHEVATMVEGGKLLSQILHQLLDAVQPGAIPLEVDKLAKQLIAQVGGSPSFMTVNNYQWATCISVNEGVVHGIPTTTPFQTGDVVGVDVGLLYKGYHTDTSWTIQIKNSKLKIKNNAENFVRTGEQALKKAITKAIAGNRIGHISQAIQETVEGAGYSVVESLAGHGIGTKLHEPPQVPGVLTRPIEKTPLLQAGMTIAIEVIYAAGQPEIMYGNSDGWTLVTKDGSLSGLFEQTVLVTDSAPRIITPF